MHGLWLQQHIENTTQLFLFFLRLVLFFVCSVYVNPFVVFILNFETYNLICVFLFFFLVVCGFVLLKFELLVLEF